jgi:hypothetical protein
MRLGDNTQLSPGGSQWTFQVCSALGTVQPSGGKGPICFTIGPLTISGASQDISTQLQAAALALTFSAGTPATGIIILGNPPANVTTSNGKCAGQGLGTPIIEVYDPNQSTTQLIELLCKSGTSAITINFTDFAGISGLTLGSVGSPGSGFFITADGAAYPNQFLNFQIETSTGTAPGGGLFIKISPSTQDPEILFEDSGTLRDGFIGWGTANCGLNVQNRNGMCLGNATGQNAAKVYASSFHAGTPNTSAVPVDGGMEGEQLNQLATKNFAGGCTMAAATSCTFTLTQGYTSTPLCFASVQNAAPTTFQGSCALSGTTVTITASAANSNSWGALLIGNPN